MENNNDLTGQEINGNYKIIKPIGFYLVYLLISQFIF
jgi:hypothetical protein